MSTSSVCSINKYGTKFWYSNNNFHREDGPAIEYPDKHIEWWLCGQMYSFNEFIKATPISDEEKTILLLTYS